MPILPPPAPALEPAARVVVAGAAGLLVAIDTLLVSVLFLFPDKSIAVALNIYVPSAVTDTLT